jgi:arabinose-5-phosphate isomerase
MLALGDALAMCVQREREFTPEEFAFYHPGGSIGRKFLRVEEIMRKGQRLATIGGEKTVKEAILAITEARSGAAIVVNEQGRVAGIFTDGDLRRHMASEPNVEAAHIESVMTRSPTTIEAGRLAVEAMRVMGERKFNQLPVVDKDGRPLGLIDGQDLLAIGLI